MAFLVLLAAGAGGVGIQYIDDIGGLISGITDVSSAQTIVESALGRAKTIIAIVVLAGAIFGILLGVILARSITKPVDAMNRVVRRLSQGDLTASCEDDGKSEMADLAILLNEWVMELNSKISILQSTATNVSSLIEPASQRARFP